MVTSKTGERFQLIRAASEVETHISSTGPIMPAAEPASQDLLDNRVTLANAIELPASAQLPVSAVVRRSGTVVLEPSRLLLDHLGVAMRNGFHKVRTTMMANFSTRALRLPKGTIIGILLRGPATLIKAVNLTTADVLGLEIHPKTSSNEKGG